MLDGIGLCFTDGTCQTYQSDYGNDGSPLTTYQLNQGDRLVNVSGIWIRNNNWYSTIVNTITFTTERGQVLGPFGTGQFGDDTEKYSFEYNLDVDCTFGIRGITGARGLSLRFLYGESHATGKLK